MSKTIDQLADERDKALGELQDADKALRAAVVEAAEFKVGEETEVLWRGEWKTAIVRHVIVGAGDKTVNRYTVSFKLANGEWGKGEHAAYVWGKPSGDTIRKPTAE